MIKFSGSKKKGDVKSGQYYKILPTILDVLNVE